MVQFAARTWSCGSTGARPELLRDQLEAALRDAIRDGRLAPGERLPSSRALAAQLGVARGVVTECYAQLQAEGYLRSQRGAATWVADTADTRAEVVARAGDVARRVAGRPPAGRPRPATRSRGRDWAQACGRRVRDAPDALLGYAGRDGRRGAARRARGLSVPRAQRPRAGPDDVVVRAGFAQGLQLVLQALAARGVTTLAVEDPGDRDSHALAERGSGCGWSPFPSTARASTSRRSRRRARGPSWSPPRTSRPPVCS